MNADEILEYCLKELTGTVLADSRGERGIFYNPEGKLTRGIYVLTVKEKDGRNASSSNLDRDEIFRVPLGIRKAPFTKLIGATPKRPGKAETVSMQYDFSSTDSILPIQYMHEWDGYVH